MLKHRAEFIQNFYSEIVAIYFFTSKSFYVIKWIISYI